MTDPRSVEQITMDRLQAEVERLRGALWKVKKNATVGYLAGGTYINPCGCDRIALAALTPEGTQDD